MTKQYSILQKKLQELESQLSTIYSFPDDIKIPEALVQDSHQRLAFLRRFLNAEIASRPSKPHHLSHISQHLDHLQHRLQALTIDSHVDEDEDDTCSCTESCLNDDGELAVEEEDVGEFIYSDCLGAEIVEEDRARIGIGKGIGLSLSEFENRKRSSICFVVGFGVMVILFAVVGLFGFGSYDRRFHKITLSPT